MSKRFKRALLCFVCVFVTAVLSCALPYISRVEPQWLNKMVISSGIGDADNYRLNDRRFIALSGEWEFYWDKFIVSDGADAAKASAAFTPDLYIQVPASWTDFELNGKKLGSGGRASYRTYVKGIRADEPVVVSVPNLPCACKVYINGQFVYSNRSFTYLHPNSQSVLQTYVNPVSLNNNGKPCEIVIEVDCDFSSGITAVPVLSTYSAYKTSELNSVAVRYLFIGVALFFAVMTLILSIMTKDSYRRFWLCALCVFFAFRLLISEDGFAVSHSLLGNLNYEVLTSLTYVLTYIIKLAMMMHIVSALDLKMKTLTTVAVAGAFLICAFFPYFVYEEIYVATTYMRLQSVAYLFDIYMIWKICGAVTDKKRFSLLYLVSYCVTAGAIVLDNFNINGYVSQRTSLVMPIACMVFIGCATIVHSVITVEAFNAAKKTGELSKELAEVNMTLMLSQIQPHFLYNALNTIKYLTKKDPKSAETAIVKFSSYLRANMDSLTQKEPIPFSKELEHVKNYADIEQLRFGDRLNIEYDISADGFSIPPLTLQPLVENAIKHGVNQRPEGGTVKISSFDTKDGYCITVKDNGIGFDVNEVKNDGRSHVGLSNIKVRLSEMSGASVDVKSEPNVGTTVTVTVPHNSQEETK